MRNPTELWRMDCGAPVEVVRARGPRRLRGLIGSRRPAPSRGLLIARCRSVHSLALPYPIDVAFLDRSLRVVAVERLRPWRFAACREAAHALELRAGECVRLGVVPGVTFVIENRATEEVSRRADGRGRSAPES